ncbi:cyclic peptide export ABC transporter [Tumebacillus permanentifrigoris]|uniref:Cyclic peptide transporter n=1 Tax=Tumebacillus permanentifrigoris TaxID=378543 RepID=A0A316D323_9BACL|nr:cyclic peptide export ABC transporter [Tumebacillus permanentifrigoris]PWK05388.1 cyclic peptide transporter [Tumebacillus permanentifrigoris]
MESILHTKQTEIISWLIIATAGLFALYCAGLVLKTLFQIVNQERKFQGTGAGAVRTVLFTTLVVGAIAAGLYGLPNHFFDGTTWAEIQALPSSALLGAFWVAFTAVVMFALHFVLTHLYPKPEERPLFTVSIFSVVSGCSYALVMFIVNTALKTDTSKLGLGSYFVLGLVLYVFGQKLVRMNLNKMTNNMLFRVRVDLIQKITKTPFYKMEEIGKEKIYTTLNNDTETISSSIGLIVIGITSSVTILTSFVYLAVSDLFALLTTAVLIVVAGVLINLTNKSAERLFSQSRDAQNVFFRYINDLLGGFKELYLNRRKRDEFREDMVESCSEYRTKRIAADGVAANVYFVGELVAFIVLGGLIFVLPALFVGVHNETLSDYVLVFLFLKGPLDNVLNMIPRITQVRVSWQRIQQISEQVARLGSDRMEEPVVVEAQVHIALQDVEFSYLNQEQASFHVGPISCEFSSGELVFITGGNGSGKSTLAKLVTGLYAPSNGQIVVNGRQLDEEHLGQHFSTVFTDYYLFEKLYGVDHADAEQEMQKYLQVLGIESKLQIVDGVFSTTKLSTGQKKRLALLITYLEDRPVYLFDEWAADQDPEFRAYFYHELLPELKARGKCVIAITHDDRYFDLADKVIKMEAGQIMQTPVPSR